MGHNQKGNTRARSLENVRQALYEMWMEYTPTMSKRELCQMISRVADRNHVRKPALEDAMPFFCNPEHEPTIEDAQALKDRQKVKYHRPNTAEPKSDESADALLAEEVVPTGVEFDGETMSSLYIAQETGKTHSHVLRDIRNILGQGVNKTNFGLVDYRDEKGEKRPCYILNKKATLLLISGYDAVLREKIIDRWEELETGKAMPMAKMDALDIMTMQIQELKNQRDRISAIENKLQQHDYERTLATEEMYRLPDATVTVAEKTTRDLIVEGVRAYSIRTGIAFNTVFREIYTQFKYRYHHDIMAIKRNGRYKSGLDVAEKYGWLAEIYAIIKIMLDKLK